MAQSDPYRTLLVHPDADDEIIQVVYRKLAQRFHPDVATAPDAERRMSELNAARDLLLDPVRRAEYDKATSERSARRARTAAREPAAETASPSSGSSASARPAADQQPRPEPTPADRPEAPGGATTGSPPGNPSGSVLNFGRYAGWSLGEIARADLEYIEWLERTPIGRPYRPELDSILRVAGRRRADPVGGAAKASFGRR